MLLNFNIRHIQPECSSYEPLEDKSHREQIFMQAYVERKYTSCRTWHKHLKIVKFKDLF
jgi:hypothetical protein